jgi:hypothetical protein
LGKHPEELIKKKKNMKTRTEKKHVMYIHSCSVASKDIRKEMFALQHDVLKLGTIAPLRSQKPTALLKL